MDKNKLVLVNPPYCLPTSPPLGVCWLKGFVERELPGWSAKVLDLNLSQAFTQALPLMRSFNPYSTHLSYFRDHALLNYARQDP